MTDWLSSTWEANWRSFQYFNLYRLVLAALFFLALLFPNEWTARLNLLPSLPMFGQVGFYAAAAIGGLLLASHIGQINFAIGFIAGIKAFTAAVLGGIGSIPGAVLGSFVLGLTESFATGYVSSDYEDVFAFSLLVLILIFRPAGLLGKGSVDKV